jgi:GNAT superfamily N-acetyltransferase
VWAEFFGLDPSDLSVPGPRVVTDAPGLTGYRGIFLLRIRDACIIGPPRELVPRVTEMTTGVAPDDLFTRSKATELAGQQAGLVLGPSWHGYLDAGMFVEPDTSGARRLGDADTDAIEAMRGAVDPAEWAEGGMDLPLPDVVWGVFDEQRLVAIGKMTDFAGRPANVGIVTRPDARGRGLATRLVGAMVADALATTDVVRYRALETNTGSLRVAARLGFVGYGANIAVRLRE